ncbi:MAG TPA: TetR/AcrR family transcriptional regulator [Solirubrobacterales bacterium]
MRALPGRSSRTTLPEPATVTRDSAAEDQRRRIMRATGELVAKRGYNDVSVELIVKRAKVSFKTFYKHFSNKEEAFLALFDLEMEAARGRVAAALEEEAESPWPAQVAAAMRALFESILADPIMAKACIVEAPTVGPVIAERYEAAMKSLAPLLREGRKQSPQGAQLPKTLEDTLAGSVLWSAYQRLIVGEVDRIEALLPEAIIFVLRPYVGEKEATRWAEESQGTEGTRSGAGASTAP